MWLSHDSGSSVLTWCHLALVLSWGQDWPEQMTDIQQFSQLYNNTKCTWTTVAMDYRVVHNYKAKTRNPAHLLTWLVLGCAPCPDSSFLHWGTSLCSLRRGTSPLSLPCHPPPPPPSRSSWGRSDRCRGGPHDALTPDAEIPCRKFADSAYVYPLVRCRGSRSRVSAYNQPAVELGLSCMTSCGSSKRENLIFHKS